MGCQHALLHPCDSRQCRVWVRVLSCGSVLQRPALHSVAGRQAHTEPWVPSIAWHSAACAQEAAGRAKVVAGAAHDDDHRRAARCQGADARNERRDRLLVFSYQRLSFAPVLFKAARRCGP